MNIVKRIISLFTKNPLEVEASSSINSIIDVVEDTSTDHITDTSMVDTIDDSIIDVVEDTSTDHIPQVSIVDRITKEF